MSDIITPATGTESVTPEPVEAPVDPKPTETVEFWKRQSREQEARAKANAAAAAELEQIRESQKTEAQKQADAVANAQRDAAEAKAQALAYKVAAQHGVTPDYFDLLGTGDEEAINARAERIGEFLRSKSENEVLRSELEALRSGKPAPATSRPVAALKPGATPEASLSEDDAAYTALYGA